MDGLTCGGGTGNAVMIKSVGFVFAEYGPLKPNNFIQNFIYTELSINSKQFYIDFSRQEHQIEL